MTITISPRVAHILKCAVYLQCCSHLCCSLFVTLWHIKLLEKITVLHLSCNLFVEMQNTCLWLCSLQFLYECIFQDVYVGITTSQFFCWIDKSKTTSPFGYSLQSPQTLAVSTIWSRELGGRWGFTNQRKSRFRLRAREGWDVNKSNKQRKKLGGYQVEEINFQRSKTRSRVRCRVWILREESGHWVRWRCWWYLSKAYHLPDVLPSARHLIPLYPNFLNF